MLEHGSLGFSNLSESIPKEFFNISSLKVISFVQNNLVGTLPSSIGHDLMNLEELYLGGNRLSGVIPDSISNCSKLTLLDLNYNHLSGKIPTSLGNLKLIKMLHMDGNMLTNDAATPTPTPELSIIVW